MPAKKVTLREVNGPVHEAVVEMDDGSTVGPFRWNEKTGEAEFKKRFDALVTPKVDTKVAALEAKLLAELKAVASPEPI